MHRSIERTCLFVSLGLIAGASTASFAAEPDSLLGPPPGSYRITSPDGTVKIPFELFRDDIRMVGEIDGKPVRMFIDNGYLWDPLLFFGSPRVDSLGFEREGDAVVSGSGTGDEVPSYQTTDITLGFPGVEFYDQTAIVTSYVPGAPNLWEGAEGQVSATFLKHFVVDIDFDEMVITLIEPDDFRYEGDGREVSLKPLGRGAWAIPAIIELADGRRLELDMAMDLGDGNPLAVQRGGPRDIPVPDEALERSLGFGIQGEVFGHFGRVRSVEIGGYRLDDVLATFAPAEHGGYEGVDVVVGMGIFSRFNIVFDYPGRRMFVAPNQRFEQPFEYDMSGMRLLKGRDGLYTVFTVHADSPASDAGLRKGDRVTHIDGVELAELPSWEIRPMLRHPGRVLTLEILRDGQRQTVTMTLRRLI
jgi:hypothetical protein